MPSRRAGARSGWSAPPPPRTPSRPLASPRRAPRRTRRATPRASRAAWRPGRRGRRGGTSAGCACGADAACQHMLLGCLGSLEHGAPADARVCPHAVVVVRRHAPRAPAATGADERHTRALLRRARHCAQLAARRVGWRVHRRRVRTERRLGAARRRVAAARRRAARRDAAARQPLLPRRHLEPGALPPAEEAQPPQVRPRPRHATPLTVARRQARDPLPRACESQGPHCPVGTQRADRPAQRGAPRPRRARAPRRTRPSYPPRTPRTPLHPSLRSTSERCATASAHAIGWRTVIAAGPMRRRRSWA